MKAVIQMTKDGEYIQEYDSTREAARHGFNSGAISNCCNDNREFHAGFRWRWAV